MEPIVITLPQLFATGAVFAVISTALAVASSRAGRATGYEIAKAETVIERRDGLTRRIEQLQAELKRSDSELRRNAIMRQTAACRHRIELRASDQIIRDLEQQLERHQLTDVERSRIKKAAQLLDWAIPLYRVIDSHEGRNLAPCAQTLLNLLKRMAPNESQLQVLPEPSVFMLPAPEREHAA